MHQLPLFHATTICGYVVNAAAVCRDCATETESESAPPVFASSEWDYRPVCDRCFAEIEGVTVLDNES